MTENEARAIVDEWDICSAASVLVAYEKGELLRDVDRDVDVLLAIEDLEDEVGELKDELALWHRLAAGIELPEYPMTTFQPKDLERENAKLRELVKALAKCRDIDCSDCTHWDYPAGGSGCALNDVMRELGIEVDDA